MQEKMKRDLEQEIKDYCLQTMYLQDLINVQSHITAFETKARLNDSPNFALITECALYDAIVLALIRLYDVSNQAKTIRALLKKCKSNIQFFILQNEIQSALNKWSEKYNDANFSKAIGTLTARRDQYIVHNDKKYFGERLKNDESYLPLYSLRELASFALEVTNTLHSMLMGFEPQMPKYDKDLDKSLYHL